MSEKLDKLRASLEKEKERRIKINNRIESLERRIQEAEAKPGDLVFFKGTYDTPGMSHTGIYLGNGMMVSAGDPIKYANIHSSYWEKHLAGFGRLSK